MNMSIVGEDVQRLGGARQHIALDGTWSISFANEAGWHDVPVPAPWQVLPGRAWQTGAAEYRRNFTVPAEWKGREIAIRFGAVGYFCEVVLNGQVLGTHEGSYLPFEFVLPAGALVATNELKVRVVQPSSDEKAYPEFPFGEIPHGKQSWYGPLAGIWQSVTLEARDARHIDHCAISADARSGAVKIALEYSKAAAGTTLRATVRYAGNGETVATVEGVGSSFELKVADPKLWSPDAPNLYSIELELIAGGQTIDRVTDSFGFRTIETRDGQILLNGEPIYLRGALDQDYYPEGISTAPSLEFLEDQARKAKALGLNLLRCHIKVPDPRYYEVADRYGLMVWTEIPNIQSFTEKSAQRLRDTLAGILRRDGNHPSIIAWTIINEDWGTRLVENEEHRRWVKDTYDWLKARDPSRLAVDNSPCFPNFHVKTDLNDYHYYKSVPERRGEWDVVTADFANAPAWTFSPHGDAEQTGNEPLVVSEFGVWGLPNPDALIKADGTEPFWMESGSSWGDGVVYPHGMKARFHELQLKDVFGSFDRFIEAVQWYQFGNLKYEIEVMRSHAPIMGYVITELTDVHWEANGLMDIERNPRVFHNRFAEINADLVILPQPQRYAVWTGEELRVDLKLATGGRTVPAGATLKWSVDGKAAGALTVGPASAVSVVDVGVASVQLHAGGKSRVAAIVFTLTAGGTELARNQIDVPVYERLQGKLPSVATRDASLASHLQGLGYAVVDAAVADVCVERELELEDIDAMIAGKRYVVLADDEYSAVRNLRRDVPAGEAAAYASLADPLAMPRSSVQALPNIVLVPRNGTIWRGDWIAGFSWIKRDGAFADIPGGPLIDLSFERVVPLTVMVGFREFEFDGLVQSGTVVGWVHKPAVLIAKRKVGIGDIVATTFRLTRDAPGADPVATSLLHAVIATAASA
jgi:hypothetical protein